MKLIVDLNFTTTTYPEWVCGSIAKDNVKEFADVYKTLVDAGGLNPSEADEDHIRTVMKLPDREVDDAVDKTTTLKSKNTKDKDAEADEEIDDPEKVEAARILAHAREMKQLLERRLYERPPAAA